MTSGHLRAGHLWVGSAPGPPTYTPWNGRVKPMPPEDAVEAGLVHTADAGRETTTL